MAVSEEWAFLATQPHSVQGHSAVDTKDNRFTPSTVGIPRDQKFLLLPGHRVCQPWCFCECELALRGFVGDG